MVENSQNIRLKFTNPPRALHLPGQVLVTPLTSTLPQATEYSRPFPSRVENPAGIIHKVLIRAVSTGAKKSDHGKVFTLRNVSPLVTCCQLKSLIKTQLKDEIKDRFDIGFVQGTSVVMIRNEEDLKDVWSSLTAAKGEKVLLWCDGLKVSCKTKSRNYQSDIDYDDSDEDTCTIRPKKKKSKKSSEKDDLILEQIEQLKGLHGERYTPMQYRIWSEMLSGGVHTSFDYPPNTSMFSRAGSGKETKVTSSKTTSDTLAQALTTVLTSKQSSVSTPEKVIDGRSK